MGGRRGAYKVLLGRSEGRGPFGKPRHRWECNIKNDVNKNPTDATVFRPRWRGLAVQVV